MRTNRVLWEVGGIRFGTFRCPTGHARWDRVNEVPGPAGFVFPRTAVRIDPVAGTGGVADAAGALFVRPGDRYVRSPLTGDGENSDWIDLSPAALRSLAESPLGEALPRSVVHVPLGPRAIARRRRLFAHVRRAAAPDLLLLEEMVDEFFADLAAALSERERPHRLDRAVAEAARAHLSRRYMENDTLFGIAGVLGTNPSRLCRAFRRIVGTTLHAHRERLRFAAALDRLEAGEGDLTRLALELGYSSHAHFTTNFRRAHGVAPSAMRADLRSGVLRA